MWGPAFAAGRKKFDDEGRLPNRCRCQCYCKKPAMTVKDDVSLCNQCALDQEMFKDGVMWWD